MVQNKEERNASHVTVKYRGCLSTSNVKGNIKGNHRCENKNEFLDEKLPLPI